MTDLSGAPQHCEKINVFCELSGAIRAYVLELQAELKALCSLSSTLKASR